MVHYCLLDAGEVFQVPGYVIVDIFQAFLTDAAEKAVHSILQRQHSARTRLEMKMFRSRCPPQRAIVEYGEPFQRTGHVQDVHKMVPYGLGFVLLTCDYKMLREDGEWIDLDAVFAALPAVEGQDRLLSREILPAKEAGIACQGVGRRAGYGGGEAGGVVLQHNLQPAGLQPTHAGRLQGPEPG